MSSLCLHERLGLEMNGAAPITLIDAHHHLWDLDCGRYPWLQGAPDPGFFLGDYQPLRRHYRAPDYLADSAAHRVLATVHCEAEHERKLDWLGGMFRRLNADVIGVQEVWDEAALKAAVARSGLRPPQVLVPGAENGAEGAFDPLYYHDGR